MSNILGLAVFATGIVLLIIGFNESQAFAVEVSRALAENSSNRSMWLILGGGAAVISGLSLAVRNRPI
ncbi:MAG TPA: DUF3185 family protein [Verrucomicrobiae bacterium]|nr:DUF3185 family protein [Verrucomicrobiae bacterium]